MSHQKRTEYMETAIRAVQAAGNVVQKALSLPKDVQNKGVVDLVTETDKECESVILDIVTKTFPEHLFIGEESATVDGKPVELSESPTWMCDPLDGTTNFVHQYPSCCVSLALWIDREPVAAVVYNPVLQEMFSAEKSKGAYMNEKRIQTSQTAELEKALFATELGVDRNPVVMRAIFDRIASVAGVSRSLRCGGSIALDMCHVACGRLDFCYEIGFGGCWDVGAGALIVREAGGRVTDPCGGPFNVLARRVLAANSHLHEKVADILSQKDFYPGEPRPLPV